MDRSAFSIVVTGGTVLLNNAKKEMIPGLFLLTTKVECTGTKHQVQAGVTLKNLRSILLLKKYSSCPKQLFVKHLCVKS